MENLADQKYTLERVQNDRQQFAAQEQQAKKRAIAGKITESA